MIGLRTLMSKKKYNLEIGERFGKRIIIEIIFGAGGRDYPHAYRLRCDCGREDIVTGSCVVKSRHCWDCRNISQRLEWGESSFNQLYRHYIIGAEKREYSFNLTKEQFR